MIESGPVNPYALDPKDPNLLDTIRKIYLDPVISGEDTNKVLIFLVCASAFTRNPLSAIVKGQSGGGKSHLVNRVLDPFRKMGVVIEFSRITGAYLDNMAKKQNTLPKPAKSSENYQALYEQWLEESKKPRRLDLTGKILFIDELRGIQNAQAPKLLISEGRLRLGTVVNGEPVEIEVIGTPVIITTTTLAVLDDPEFENRVLPIQIDETEDQTRQVLEFEARHYEDPAKDLTEHARTQALTEFFESLKPYDVANPYARKLADDYPKKNIEARRDYPKLLNLCNVVTWLYQNQRARAAKGVDLVFVADLKDVEKVRDLALAPLRESLAGLSEKEEKLLEVAKQATIQATTQAKTIENEIQERLKREPDTGEDKIRQQVLASWPEKQKLTAGYDPLIIQQFYTRTRRTVRRGEQWVRDHVKRLSEEGYLEQVEMNKKPFTWRYAELQPESLEIKTEEYSRQVLTEWAQKHGYNLTATPVLEMDTTQGQAKSSPLERLEPKTSPKSEFGEPALPASRFGEGQPGNGGLSISNPSMGIKCPRCHINWPDQPSFDNHLSTYRHDEAAQP